MSFLQLSFGTSACEVKPLMQMVITLEFDSGSDIFQRPKQGNFSLLFPEALIRNWFRYLDTQMLASPTFSYLNSLRMGLVMGRFLFSKLRRTLKLEQPYLKLWSRRKVSLRNFLLTEVQFSLQKRQRLIMVRRFSSSDSESQTGLCILEPNSLFHWYWNPKLSSSMTLNLSYSWDSWLISFCWVRQYPSNSIRRDFLQLLKKLKSAFDDFLVSSNTSLIFFLVISKKSCLLWSNLPIWFLRFHSSISRLFSRMFQGSNHFDTLSYLSRFFLQSLQELLISSTFSSDDGQYLILESIFLTFLFTVFPKEQKHSARYSLSSPLITSISSSRLFFQVSISSNPLMYSSESFIMSSSRSSKHSEICSPLSSQSSLNSQQCSIVSKYS